MTSDKRLPVDGDLDARLTAAWNSGSEVNIDLMDVVSAILQINDYLLEQQQITRPAGAVAENATTAKRANSPQLENLSNSTPLPEHFQSFHADCDTENHDVIRALTNSNNLLIQLHGMLFFQNTAHKKREKIRERIVENNRILEKQEAK